MFRSDQFRVAICLKNCTAMTTPLGRFICRVRTVRRLSKKQLAFELGVDPSYISRIESGGKAPANRAFLDSVVRALTLSPDEAEELYRASKESQKSLQIPPSSTERGCSILRKLASSLPQLNEPQMTVLESLIDAINAGEIGISAK